MQDEGNLLWGDRLFRLRTTTNTAPQNRLTTWNCDSTSTKIRHGNSPSGWLMALPGAWSPDGQRTSIRIFVDLNALPTARRFPPKIVVMTKPVGRPASG